VLRADPARHERLDQGVDELALGMSRECTEVRVHRHDPALGGRDQDGIGQSAEEFYELTPCISKRSMALLIVVRRGPESSASAVFLAHPPSARHHACVGTSPGRNASVAELWRYP